MSLSTAMLALNTILPAHAFSYGRLSMMVSGPTSYIGFEVTISGKATGADGTGLSNAPVYLWYRFQSPGYNEWSTIAVTQTGGDGNYSIQWIPTATGNYIIQGSVFCNNPADGCATSSGQILIPVFVSLDVLPTGNQQLLSVASNSTIASLSFDGTSRILAFQLNGTKGTTAWVGVSIATSLLPNANLLQVQANSANVPFQATMTGGNWLVTFTVHFESVVSVSLSISSSNSLDLGVLSVYLTYGLIFIIGLMLGLRWRWLSARLRPMLGRSRPPTPPAQN